ncbi:hypothetical protein MANES_01G226900v8 [Manihot esculenta]|uniref:Uncharacterized protein n=1 Tax=Manihot esculenta TaxID=3983 RepID=A0A2C9WN88_MANES|nr:hypothetical protein MANES_01G226900v8 [Manihot esculenta]
MGNFASCFHIPTTAKLMDFHGNLRQLLLPLKAADLMLEEPGHVVSSLHDLRRTRRLSALRAEDEIFAGKIYILVPLSKVHRKISDSEMAILESAEKRSKKKRSGAKILPAVPVTVEVETEMVEALEGLDSGFGSCRLGNYCHWTPVLEPILEEP